MGSDSDWPTMKAAADACSEFEVGSEVQVISAHRTPDDLARYAKGAVGTCAIAHTRCLEPSNV